MGDVTGFGKAYVRHAQARAKVATTSREWEQGKGLQLAAVYLGIDLATKPDVSVIRKAYAVKVREAHPDTAVDKISSQESAQRIKDLRRFRDMLVKAAKTKTPRSAGAKCAMCGGSGNGKGFAVRCLACAGTGKSRSKVR